MTTPGRDASTRRFAHRGVVLAFMLLAPTIARTDSGVPPLVTVRSVVFESDVVVLQDVLPEARALSVLGSEGLETQALAALTIAEDTRATLIAHGRVVADVEWGAWVGAGSDRRLEPEVATGAGDETAAVVLHLECHPSIDGANFMLEVAAATQGNGIVRTRSVVAPGQAVVLTVRPSSARRTLHIVFEALNVTASTAGPRVQSPLIAVDVEDMSALDAVQQACAQVGAQVGVEGPASNQDPRVTLRRSGLVNDIVAAIAVQAGLEAELGPDGLKLLRRVLRGEEKLIADLLAGDAWVQQFTPPTGALVLHSADAPTLEQALRKLSAWRQGTRILDVQQLQGGVRATIQLGPVATLEARWQSELLPGCAVVASFLSSEGGRQIEVIDAPGDEIVLRAADDPALARAISMLAAMERGVRAGQLLPPCPDAKSHEPSEGELR